MYRHNFRNTLFKKQISDFKKNYLLCKNYENYKHQIPKLKWFDKLTTLSRVEGQIPMT